MNSKKALAGMLAISMCAALFGGCGAETPTDAPAATTAAAAGGEASEETTAATTASTEGLSIETSAVEAETTPEDLTDAQYWKDFYGTDSLIQLTAFSELANYNGKATGWFAQILKDKFNCEVTIVPATDGAFDTRMEAGNLGDLVVFGSDGGNYQRAAKEGMLFDWEEDGLIDEFGAYTRDNMPYALNKNRTFNESFGAGSKIFGFGHNVATSPEDHEAFFYTMDMRWDLYKQLNYPKMSTLDDLYDVFVQMKELQPTDANGKESYAMSLWPDWDGNMVMYVKAFATCWYGMDEMGFGLYDVENGVYHDATEEGGPYLTSLKFFNKLYRAGLIDPNSMTQTYNEMSEKVQAGGVFFSIFDYAGSALYNTEDHLTEGKGMYPVVPDEARPLCYGMNVMGGNRIWTIGASTEYPELVMAIINYLVTPEGCMTSWYGPKDLCWYYDEEGHTCLTEFGETCQADKKNTTMPAEWGGGSYNDGSFQVNNTTWTRDAKNPDSNGETYNLENWVSRRHDTDYDILSDWRTWSGFYNSQEYMDSVPHKTSIATAYSETDRSDELKVIWQQVADCIVTDSWKAVYAATDEEYESYVNDMISKIHEYDPNGECLAYCNNEAAKRDALEDAVRAVK
ncbi:MAG: hypothetical protein J6F31_00850 [Oscillospiraceae bacterium]|nr:hypothetical protein [Oscillospiraceae bacterium]